jgi:ketosteroid isomerase-like protein
MSAAKVELARRALEAWDQRDTEWFVDNTTPDFEFVPAVVTGVEGQAGAVRGANAIQQFFADLDEPWESFVIDEVDYREVDEQVVCVGRLRAKGRGSGVELNQPVAMVLWFGHDKLARARSFLDPAAATEAAGHERTV